MNVNAYVCLRADVIGSRGTRKAALLPEIAQALNARMQTDNLIPFTPRAGDELFAVFGSIQSGYQAFRWLHRQAHAHQLGFYAVSYTHLRAHETPEHLVCRLLLEKKKTSLLENYRLPHSRHVADCYEAQLRTFRSNE